MKLKANKEALLKAISVVDGAVSSRATLPILSNILIETTGKNQIKITGTDLEIGIVCQLPIDVQEEGSVTVPAKKLYDIVRELSQGDLEFIVAKNNTITIKNDKSHFKIMGLPKDDFPKLPDPDFDNCLEIDQKTLKESFNLTTFAVSHDETRFVLNGVLCQIKAGKMKIVATDGRRLAFVQKEIKTPNQFSFEGIIPSKTVQELNKLMSGQGEMKIIPLKNQIMFHFGDIWVISRLIEGHFPNYEQVIPKEEKTISTVDRETFLSAVRRASLLTSPESQSVKLDVLKNKLLISSRCPNLGEAREEVEASTEGEDLVIGFNPGYLIDVLKNLDVEKISLGLTNSDKPGMVKGKDNYLCVIMPMQLT